MDRQETTQKRLDSKSSSPLSGGLLQRKRTYGQRTTDHYGRCTECKKKGLALQRRAVNQNGPEVAPPIVHEVLRSPGRPLDPATRANMESRFDHDFSEVSLHTDTTAVASAQAVNALAYTVGNHVVFGPGQHNPQTAAGRQLLAHELAHTIQQRGNGPTARLLIGPSSTPAEQAATRSAEQVVQGNRPLPLHRTSSTIIQRQGNRDYRLHWPGFGRQSASGPRLLQDIELRLSLDDEAQIAAFIAAMQIWLSTDNIRRSILQINYSTFLATQPPAWSTLPSPGATQPLVSPGTGPETPRAANFSDFFSALLATHIVNSLITSLSREAIGQALQIWERLSTGEQVLLISHTALLGSGVVAGILSSPGATQSTLDLLQNRTLPVPGVPGLTLQFNLTGPNQMVQFNLNVGALLPPSLGFR
jgi:hypothetical protein